jgi:hypothetical protein
VSRPFEDWHDPADPGLYGRSERLDFGDVVAELLALVGQRVVVAFVGVQPATLATFAGTLEQARQVGERCGSEALLLAVGEEGSLVVYADVLFGGAIREAGALVVRQGGVDVVVEWE